jgi:hypothetical protein
MNTVPVSPVLRSLRKWAAWTLCLIVCGALFSWIRRDPFDNEVFNLYAGAKVGAQRLYHSEDFAEVAASLGVKVHESRFFYCRMPYFEVLTKPLSWMPYPVAVAAWRFVQMLSIGLAVFLWPGWKPTMVKVTLLSMPAVAVIGMGQDVGLVFLFIAASVALAWRGRFFLAGVVFSLCLSKPHLVIFVPVAMLAMRNFRFLAGATAGASSLLLLSFSVAPWSWPQQWLATLADPRMHHAPTRMPGLLALTQTGWPGIVLALLVVVALAIAIWRIAPCRRIEEVFAYALAAGMVANLHSYAVDCIMLIPAVTLAVRSGRSAERRVGLCMATPVPYFLLILGWPAALQAGILALVGLAFAPPANVRKPAAAPCEAIDLVPTRSS